MRDCGEGGDNDRGNSACTGYYVQGNCAVGAIIEEWELGGDGGHAKSTRGITSLVRKKYYGDDEMAYAERIVEVVCGGWSARNLWIMSNQGIYPA